MCLPLLPVLISTYITEYFWRFSKRMYYKTISQFHFFWKTRIRNINIIMKHWQNKELKGQENFTKYMSTEVSTLSYTDRVITIVSPISTCCLSSRNELTSHRHCQAVVTLKWNQQNSVLSLTLLSPTLYFYSRWQCLIVFTKQLLHNSYMENFLSSIYSMKELKSCKTWIAILSNCFPLSCLGSR